jgi:hypothetical protein
MTALLLLFVDLCRLRGGPQDLPYSRFLLLLTTAGYAAVGLGVATLDQAPGLALLSAAVDTGLLLGLGWLGLWVRERKPRAVQTLTALTGTGTLFGLLGWPLIAWMQRYGAAVPLAPSLLLLALIVWNISVIGNILRHALDLPLWLGAGVALLYVYTSIRVMSVLHLAGTAT